MSRKHRLPQEIKDLLDEIDWTEPGPRQRALIDRALALSRETGDERAEYEVRFRLTSSGTFAGDFDAALSSFAWCLAKHDADPRRFPNVIDSGYDLMWQFKWMINKLDASPIFSLAQCDAMLDDMESHYRRAGLGMSGVVTCRFLHAWYTGDFDRARQLRAQLQATPRDDHSDCDACVRSELSGFAMDAGEESLALKLIDEIVEGEYSCAEEPARALGRTLLAKLRAGRTQDALGSHMQSYRLARTNPANIETVADSMVFCAVTGNEARGLAMVERHIPWLAHDALNEDGQLLMLAAVGLVLESVVRAGHGEQVVRGAAATPLERFFGTHEGIWTVAELAPQVWQATDRLASTFDTRNGNSYVSDRTAQTRALLDERYDLPILTDVFLPPPAAPQQPTTAQHWLDLAEVYSYASRPDPAMVLETAVKALNPQIPSGDPDAGPGPTSTQQARATGLLISSYLQLDRTDDARLVLPRRVAALRAEGRTVLADLEEKTDLATYGRHTPETVAILRAEVARLAGTDDAGRAEAELCLAQALLEGDDPDLATVVPLLESVVARSLDQPRRHAAALHGLLLVHQHRQELAPMVDLCDRILGLDLPDGLRARFLAARARLMGALVRHAEGLADADAAVKIYAAYGAAQPLVDALVLAAVLGQEAGRPDESLSRLRYALREAEQAEIDTVGVRYQLGRALVATGHPTEGVEILWQVLNEEEEAEARPEVRAETCLALEQAFEAAEEYSSALSMCDRAAALWQEADQPANAADMLRRMGNILRGFEMHDESLDVLSQAWDLVKDTDALGMQVEVLEARAFTKGANGDRSALSDMDRAVAVVQALPDGPHLWKIADLTDSKARVLMDLERRDEAVAGFLQAADGYAQVGDLASAARAEHFAAQNLADPLARPAEALGIWHSALDHAEAALTQGQEATTLRESILLKLAEALDALGRTAEAAATRSQITSQDIR
ncbi:MAG: hypothetical protein FWH11_08490 [Micrococcales bacterium]|nr:hypothetical protein [Micrococcales bacterium]